MNVYYATICENCKKPTAMNVKIMVHGADNLNLAMKLLERQLVETEGVNIHEVDIEQLVIEVKKQFCGYCGGHMPCGCPKPYSQA